jgi:hypothetical protein
MAYAVPPDPQAKQRPTSVTVAVALMYGVLVAQLIGVIISFLPNPELQAAIDDFVADHPEFSGSTGTDPASMAIGLLIPAVVIIGFGVLAFFVGKGSRPARIVTFVLSGLGVLCLGCVQLFTAALPSLLSGAAGSSEDEQVQTAADFIDLVALHTPDWQETLSTALGWLSLLALILVIILLAVPSANEYFRKQEQVWVPPTAPPGGGWPQVPPPGTPQNPPYPPSPGQ